MRSSWTSRLVLAASAVLLLSWMGLHAGELAAVEQNGVLRLLLASAFGLLLLLRPKLPDEGTPPSTALIVSLAASGLVLTVVGLVFRVNQFEWLGLLAMLFACVRWALEDIYAGDIRLAVFLLYWAHPLPSQVFTPLQLAMQRLSVLGAEWVLHVANFRVWADGLVLRTITNTYDVPAWCSGMRTATTVFLLVLGLGFLRRLPWHEIAVFLVAGLLQALALNVLRLCTMVALAPRVGDRTGVSILHDTAGLIVIAAVFLVYAELAAWQRFKARRQREVEEPEPPSVAALGEHPPFWAMVLKRRAWILTATLALLVLAGVVYRSRTFHRAEMLKDVARGLRDTDHVDEAQRAADLVARMVPDDLAWRMERVRLLLIRERNREVLVALEDVPDFPGAFRMEKLVVRAYALMGLDRIAEASAIIGELPEPLRRIDPRVAMILAEMRLQAGDADGVAESVLVGAAWPPNRRRIRALYPYLRRHRKWEAIAASDTRTPYADAAQALAAAEAYMNLDRISELAEVIVRAAADWPDDPRLLEPLFYLAMKRPDSQWESVFAAHLSRCTRTVREVELLADYLDRSFLLARPDLAWRLYARMSALDPQHPALALAVVRHGPAWFRFRKRFLGFNAPSPADTVDLAPHYLLGALTPGWRRLCAAVPLGDLLARRDAAEVHGEYLQKALDGFSARAREGHLALNMRYQYAMALDLANDVPAAARLLEGVLADNPGESNRVNQVLSEMFERRGEWQAVYERLTALPIDANANLNVVMRLCKAQINLKLGLAALHTAHEAVRLFPHSTHAPMMLAVALSRFDSYEEALSVVQRPQVRRYREMDRIEAEALFRTQRFGEGDAFCRSVLLPRRLVPLDAKQDLLLPPAELAALWHRVYLPSEREFATNAAILEASLPTTTSPFLREVMTLWLRAYRAPESTATDPARWVACARSRVESATALHQLALLLCRHDPAAAREVVGRAVKSLPEAPLLWRMLISLSGADPAVLDAARRACPEDSEVWLANVVAQTQIPRGGTNSPAYAAARERVTRDVREAAARDLYSPAAMTRAAEYLLRVGMKDAAALAARDAVDRARGLLPAYVVSIRCALLKEDREWALASVKRAIESSLYPPPPFFKSLVQLRVGQEGVGLDSDLVVALTNLRRQEPRNPLWAQILGYVRYKRGGWETVDALYQMTSAIEAGATNRTPYVVAAEAARLLGNYERSADLLRSGLKRFPDDAVMLNNLVYSLTFTPDRRTEAVALVPQLEAAMPDDPSALDTIAVTYLRAGVLDKAQGALAKLQAQTEPGSRLWFRAAMHRAEVSFRLGNRGSAAADLERALASAHGVPDEDILAANRLLAEMRKEPARP